MRLKAELGGDAQSRHHFPPPRSCKGRAASDVNTNGDGGSWSRLIQRSARSSTPLKG